MQCVQEGAIYGGRTSSILPAVKLSALIDSVSKGDMIQAKETR